MIQSPQNRLKSGLGHNMKLRPLSLPLITTALVALAISSNAQSITGSITGIVTDSSGGLIPGAQITVLNLGTNIQSKTTSDASGNYTVPLLPRGDYRLEVSAQGFKRFVREGIVLQVQQTARIDVQMAVGEVAD